MMISIEEYFERFLGYAIGTMSNDNLRPHDIFYETYRNLDDKLLEVHAELEKNSAAMEELGERYYYMKHDIEAAIPWFEEASKLGNGEASALLSQIYRIDLKEWDKYFEYVQLSAEQGCAMGLFNLSCCYYKGKDAYEGHGFDEDKEKAMELSITASHRSREMIHFLLTHRCSNGFKEYLEQQINIFVNSTCSSAEQMINGKSAQKNKEDARILLTEANNFAKEHFGCDAERFTVLLQTI